MTETPWPRLPWHRDPWQRLESMIDGGRLHHAVLLAGEAGLGKQRFAERAAAALLCEDDVPAAQRPCGTCRSCALVLAGSHPDRLSIAPAPDKRTIGVDQVRDRIADLTLTAHYAPRRVALVSPADALNRHAADTLLKTLEEPSAAVVFLLVSSRPAALSVTLRSRCLRLRFAPARSEQARDWLEGEGIDISDDRLLTWFGGAPLAAAAALEERSAEPIQSMASDLQALLGRRLAVVAAAQRWRGVGLSTTLDWQLRIVTALMRRAAGAGDGAAQLATKGIDAKLDLRVLNGLCEELLELRSATERALNPNEQLALEHIAASWAALAVHR